VSVPVTVRRRWSAIIAAVVAIVVLDQVAKIWAVTTLSDHSIWVIGNNIGFELTRNSGGAFGRFRGMTTVLALGAIAVSGYLVYAVRRVRDRWLLVALTLVLGGALGNLTDRIFRAPGFLKGHVVDFVRVGSFPVFNVADSCITIGATILVIRTVFPPRTALESPEAPSPPAS
jgi:signal peptidase II